MIDIGCIPLNIDFLDSRRKTALQVIPSKMKSRDIANKSSESMRLVSRSDRTLILWWCFEVSGESRYSSC